MQPMRHCHITVLYKENKATGDYDLLKQVRPIISAGWACCTSQRIHVWNYTPSTGIHEAERWVKSRLETKSGT